MRLIIHEDKKNYFWIVNKYNNSIIDSNIDFLNKIQMTHKDYVMYLNKHFNGNLLELEYYKDQFSNRELAIYFTTREDVEKALDWVESLILINEMSEKQCN